jgi:3-hydroxyisobutyrate dehydrogenase
MMAIAFLGLGNMGGRMVRNLLRAGHAVTGFDPSEAACAAARDAGIAIADSAREAVSAAECVITMLPGGQQVLAACEGEAGILHTMPASGLFIDCSTIDVESARAVHAMAHERGLMSVDAPVSGGIGGAAAGTLTFMAGGEPAHFERAELILAAMGSRIVHCGGPGAGQAAKICNNMILGISMIAVSEAFVLAEKLGLSHQALYDVASTSSGQCWSLTTYCPVPGPVPASPANNGYKPGFAAALMLKDLALSQDAAAAFGTDTELGRHARAIYQRFADAGHASEDFSAIITDIRDRSGKVT